MDRAIKKKTFTVKRIITAVASIAFVAVVANYYFWGDHSSKLQVEVDRLTINAVEFGPFQETVVANGNFIPRRTEYLDAIEGGRVRVRHANPGDSVVEGQPLLEFENTGLRFQIMSQEASIAEQQNRMNTTEFQLQQSNLQAQSQLATAEYNLKRLERDYLRKKTLFGKNAVSEEIYLVAKDEFEFSSKSLELARAKFKADSSLSAQQLVQIREIGKRMIRNFNFAQDRLKRLTLRAPATGLLTSFVVEIGESKMAGTRLGYIDVVDQGYKARVKVDEYYLPRITSGLMSTFELAGKTYKMRITNVYPEVLNNLFDVDMEFVEEVPQDIRNGQTIHPKLQLSELSKKLLIPRGGFFSATGGNWIFVVNEQTGMAERRDIRVGKMNNSHFEVLEGLEEGEKVITSTYDNYGNVDKLILNGEIK